VLIKRKACEASRVRQVELHASRGKSADSAAALIAAASCDSPASSQVLSARSVQAGTFGTLGAEGDALSNQGCVRRLDDGSDDPQGNHRQARTRFRRLGWITAIGKGSRCKPRRGQRGANENPFAPEVLP
jgi:hypothetical protein